MQGSNNASSFEVHKVAAAELIGAGSVVSNHVGAFLLQSIRHRAVACNHSIHAFRHLPTASAQDALNRVLSRGRGRRQGRHKKFPARQEYSRQCPRWEFRGEGAWFEMPMKHPDINLKLTHKAQAYPVSAPSNATFGDLKVHANQAPLRQPHLPCEWNLGLSLPVPAQNYAAKEIGVPPQGIQLLFRGRKKADHDVLSLAGVKNGASALRSSAWTATDGV